MIIDANDAHKIMMNVTQQEREIRAAQDLIIALAMIEKYASLGYCQWYLPFTINDLLVTKLQDLGFTVKIGYPQPQYNREIKNTDCTTIRWNNPFKKE